jgi:hypothetical protein
MPDVEAVQVCGHNGDRQLTDDLPLVSRDEGAIHVPDNELHWRAGFVARGGVDFGVSFAVVKPPEDGWRVDFRVLGWSIGREGWRKLAAVRG